MNKKVFELNADLYPNLCNLLALPETCDLDQCDVGNTTLAQLIQGITQELHQLNGTVVTTFTTPYMTKLWDMFYDHKFTGVIIHDDDSGYDTSIEKLVEGALMDVALYYV